MEANARSYVVVGDDRGTATPVAGVQHYQEALTQLVGALPDPVRLPVHAILVAEPDNPHDGDAVAVHAGELKIGHLPRKDAARLQPGLLRLEREAGARIAVPAVIFRQPDDPLICGVLGINHAAFGLPEPELVSITQTNKVTIESSVSMTLAHAVWVLDDLVENPLPAFQPTWRETIPEDLSQRVAFLRDLIGREPDPIERHYQQAELWGSLYRARDEGAWALSEFDAACEAHHADMGAIRPALVAAFGDLPLLEVYKQAAVRHQKAGNWQEALRWADAGVAMYGDQASRPEFREDLEKRAARYREKLRPAQPR